MWRQNQQPAARKPGKASLINPPSSCHCNLGCLVPVVVWVGQIYCHRRLYCNNFLVEVGLTGTGDTSFRRQLPREAREFLPCTLLTPTGVLHLKTIRLDQGYPISERHLEASVRVVQPQNLAYRDRGYVLQTAAAARGSGVSPLHVVDAHRRTSSEDHPIGPRLPD